MGEPSYERISTKADAVLFWHRVCNRMVASSVAMSRLLGGLELLGEGFATRLVLSELPLPWPRYRDAAQKIMGPLGMSQEILVVGPVLNTHDEAVAVGKLVAIEPSS
jgi:hypothetical protein